MTLKMALRNLTRHRGRSAIMIATLALFMSLSIFLEAVASGFYGSMIEAAISQTLGEAQLHHKGHLPSRDVSKTLPAALLTKVSGASGIQLAVPRVRVPAMATAKEAQPIDLIGVVPRLEEKFGSIGAGIKLGRYLRDGELRSVVVGAKLAARLSVTIGDDIGLMAGDNMEPTSYRLVGIFRSGSSIADARVVHVPLPQLRRQLNLTGDAITEIAIRSTRKGEAPELGGICDGACVAQSWRQLNPALYAAMTTDHNFLRAISFVLLVVLGLMVLNLQMMSVLERTPELGVLMAIGTRPARLFVMIVVEAIILGAVGIGLGLLVGLLLSASLSGGVDMTKFMGGESEFVGFALVPVIVPIVRGVTVFTMSAAAFSLTTLAAVLPGARIFRLDALAAMRSAGENL